MTRRILLVLLAFTATVLVAAVVPLALDAAGHDRTSFIQATEGMARLDAVVAQARLDDQADAPLVSLINQTQQAGDGLLIFKGDPRDDNRLTDKGMPGDDWVKLATEADEASQLARRASQPIEPVTEVTGSRVAAAMPVFRRGGYGLVGIVVLARSSASLDRAIVALWAILGTVAVVAMIGAALQAAGQAGQRGRPAGRR